MRTALHDSPLPDYRPLGDGCRSPERGLWRSDTDAVLVGIAELVASHDDQVEAQVLEQADPNAQLDFIIRTVVQAGGHGNGGSAALRVTLPPEAQEVLARHQDRIVRILAKVVRTGVEDGVFRNDLEPSADAPLILGLSAAADSGKPERAIALVHRMVESG